MGRAEFPQTAPLILPVDQNLKWAKDFVFNAGIRGEKGVYLQDTPTLKSVGAEVL